MRRSMIRLLSLLLSLLFGGVLLGQSQAADKFDLGVEALLAGQSKADYQEMVKRGYIRVLMPYSRTFFFLDGATPKGLSYEALQLFEKELNKAFKSSSKIKKIRVLTIPTTRNELLPRLVEGYGDIAVGNLTITAKRKELVDFSDPMARNVDEILVTGPKSPTIESLEGLSGKTLHIRRSSSYRESIDRLNEEFQERGLAPVKIINVSEYLEDEDLMEMVAAGALSAIIVDSHKADLWAEVLDDLVLHHDIKVNSGGAIAWAVRKNNPQLKKKINTFVKTHKQGTLMGNILIKRYFENNPFIHNNTADEEVKKLYATLDLFQKYAGKYSFDWLMLAALAYQESKIDQSKRSPAGAVGVMQILPSTAKDKNVGIPDIEKIEPNIHAGTKYIRFMVNRYFNDPQINELNRGLFAFASYNAGPARVAKMRKEADQSGLDPNVWFNNVEVIAAKRIGRETVDYVRNIFKYYTAYRYIVEQEKMKEVVREAHSG